MEGGVGGGAGERFECEDFGRERCGEEAGLAGGGRGERRQACFYVGEHAAGAGGEEAVGFVEDDDAGALETGGGVVARGGYVVG